MRAEFLRVSVLEVASGPGMELAGYGGALDPPPPSQWFVLLAVLGRWSRCWSCSLLLCRLIYETVCFVSCPVLFVLVFFGPFGVVVASLGSGVGWGRGGGAGLGAFRTFVRFALVWFCLFPLPLGVWEGLRIVIVALLDFSLTFFCIYLPTK